MARESLEVEVAELRVEVRHLADAVEKMSSEVKTHTAALNEARGGYKALGALAGLAGAAAGALASLFLKTKGG